MIWTILSELSYQYYSTVGIIVTFVVSHFVQLIIWLFKLDGIILNL